MLVSEGLQIPCPASPYPPQPGRHMARGSPSFQRKFHLKSCQGAANITNSNSYVVLPLSWKIKIN